MFDADGDVQREEFPAPIEGEKHQFRFIFAPDDGDELDLREYTRSLVGRMEKDLGRELRWAAVRHYPARRRSALVATEEAKLGQLEAERSAVTDQRPKVMPHPRPHRPLRRGLADHARHRRPEGPRDPYARPTPLHPHARRGQLQNLRGPQPFGCRGPRSL